MTLKRITSSTDPLLAKVPKLYEEAFPPIARLGINFLGKNIINNIINNTKNSYETSI